jgi:hypothetical protein
MVAKLRAGDGCPTCRVGVLVATHTIDAGGIGTGAAERRGLRCTSRRDGDAICASEWWERAPGRYDAGASPTLDVG